MVVLKTLYSVTIKSGYMSGKVAEADDQRGLTEQDCVSFLLVAACSWVFNLKSIGESG